MLVQWHPHHIFTFSVIQWYSYSGILITSSLYQWSNDTHSVVSSSHLHSIRYPMILVQWYTHHIFTLSVIQWYSISCILITSSLCQISNATRSVVSSSHPHSISDLMILIHWYPHHIFTLSVIQWCSFIGIRITSSLYQWFSDVMAGLVFFSRWSADNNDDNFCAALMIFTKWRIAVYLC